MRSRRFPKLRRAAQTLLLAAASLSLTLLALELGVRLLAPQQLIVLRPDLWQPTDGVGWRHRANADTVINTGDGPARIVTDGRGHRIAPGPLPSDPTLRVLALGDSFLEAIQVDYADTFAARLEQSLAAARGETVRVVNTGVGGWDPEQYLLEARAELERRDYDAVLVFAFLPNDLVLRRRGHLPPRQAAERRRLRWPRAASKRELVDAVAYPVNDVLERHSQLFMLLRNRAKFLLMRAGLSAHYFPAVLRTGGNLAALETWRTTAEIVAEIRDLAAARGVPMLAVLLPGVYQVDAEAGRRYAQAVGLEPTDYDLDLPSRLFGQALGAEHVPFLDTLPALRSALAAGRGPLFGQVDTHLAPAGHQVVAETVMPHLSGMLTPQP